MEIKLITDSHIKHGAPLIPSDSKKGSQTSECTNNNMHDIFQNKKFGLLQIILKLKMKKYAKRILYQTSSKMFSILKDYHFSFFSDHYLIKSQQTETLHKESISFSTDSELTTKRNKGQLMKWMFKILKPISNTLKYFCKCKLTVILPSNNYKLAWDVSMLLDTMIMLFYIPLHISFGSQFIYEDLLHVLIIRMILDFFVQTNTGFYDRGICIKDRFAILKRYFYKNFFTDLICYVPIIFLYINQSTSEQISQIENNDFLNPNQLILLFFFVKISHFSKVSNKIEQSILLSQKIRNILRLLKLMLTIVVIAHFFASFWLLLAHIEEKFFSDSYSSWIQVKEINDSTKVVKYIYAYYYTIVTIVTVVIRNVILKQLQFFILHQGYGDISPQNPIEMGFAICIIIIGCGVFAYSLNLVGIIFQELNKYENQVKNNMYIINNYMAKKQVNPELQFQIRKYLEYYWRESAEQNQNEEDQIIGQLTRTLQDQLLFEANKIILKQSPIFANNFSEAFLHKTIPLIKEYRSIPEEILYKEGELDDQSIYFIEKGEVQIYHDIMQTSRNRWNGADVKKSVIQTLHSGQCFGQFSFFTGNTRNFCARCTEFCTLLVINRQDFIDLLKTFPQDYERFCQIKDTIMLQKNYDQIQYKCYSCKSSKHSIDQCPLLHYIANTKKIIYFHCRNIFQDRNNYFKRNHKSKLNSLLNSGFVQVIISSFNNNEAESVKQYLDQIQEERKDRRLHTDPYYYDNNQIDQEQNNNQESNKISQNKAEEAQKSDIDSQNQSSNQLSQLSNSPQKQSQLSQSPKQDEQPQIKNMINQISADELVKENQSNSPIVKNLNEYVTSKSLGSYEKKDNIQTVENQINLKKSEFKQQNDQFLQLKETSKINNQKSQKQFDKQMSIANSKKKQLFANYKSQNINTSISTSTVAINNQATLYANTIYSKLVEQQNNNLKEKQEQTLLKQPSQIQSPQPINDLIMQMSQALTKDSIFFRRKQSNNIIANPFQNQLQNYSQQVQEQYTDISEFKFAQYFEKYQNFTVYMPWNNIQFIQDTQKLNKQQVAQLRQNLIDQSEKRLSQNIQQKQLENPQFTSKYELEDVNEQLGLNNKINSRQSLQKSIIRKDILITQSKRIALRKQDQRASQHYQQQQPNQGGDNINQNSRKCSKFQEMVSNDNNCLSIDLKLSQDQNNIILNSGQFNMSQVKSQDDSLIKEESIKNLNIPITSRGKFLIDHNVLEQDNEPTNRQLIFSLDIRSSNN